VTVCSHLSFLQEEKENNTMDKIRNGETVFMAEYFLLMK
jgi:hypothetical protein